MRPWDHEPLAALKRPDPEVAELKAIRELLDAVQEERVVSDEEIQRLKKLESKFLESQKKLKNKKENMSERTKFQITFCMLFSLPAFLCFFFTRLEFQGFGKYIILMSCWPTKLIVLFIMYYFYGFNLKIKFRTSKPQVLEEEDDDWHDTMTSAELQSRGKALVNSWKQLRRERKEQESSEVWFFIAQAINLNYVLFRVVGLHWFLQKESDNFSSLSSLTEPAPLFFLVDYIFSIFMALLFCFQNKCDD